MKINIEITEYSSHEELSSKDQELIAIAISQLKTSHSPYSNFSVGASVRLENDKTWGGSNQENSSYPGYKNNKIKIGQCWLLSSTQAPDNKNCLLGLAIR